MLCKRWLMGLAVLAGLALAGPAHAQDRSPWAMVPDKAPVVISIRGLKATTDRALKMVKNAVPELADKLKEVIDEGTKKALEGREGVVKGLAEGGPILVAFTELPKGGGEPGMAVIARVKDFKAFRDGFLKEDERKDATTKDGIESVTIDGKASFLVDAGGYAVLTTSEPTAQAFAKKKVNGLEKKLDADALKRLASADVGIYVDMGAVLEEFAEQIRTAHDQANDALSQVENLGNVNKGQLKLAKMLMDAGFRTIQDSRSFIYTISFEPEGLALHIGLGLAKDSTSAKFLKDMKPADLAGLSRLPTGFLTYTGMELDPQMFKLIQPIAQGVLAEPGTDEAKKIAKALDRLVAAGPRTMTQAQAVPARGLAATEFDDPAKALDATLQLLQDMSKGEQFHFMPLKDGIKIKRKAQSYRGSDWHEVSMKWDLEKMLADLPGGAEELVKAMKKLTGEGANIWLGVVDKAVVTATAKDWKDAQKLIDQYAEKKNDLSNDKNFRAVREHLPRQASLVQLINMRQYVDLITEFVGPILAMAGQNVEIPPSKEKEPGYVGFSMTLVPRQVGLDLFISGRAAREVYRAVDPFIKKFAGGAF